MTENNAELQDSRQERTDESDRAGYSRQGTGIRHGMTIEEQETQIEGKRPSRKERAVQDTRHDSLITLRHIISCQGEEQQ